MSSCALRVNKSEGQRMNETFGWKEGRGRNVKEKCDDTYNYFNVFMIILRVVEDHLGPHKKFEYE